MADPKIPEAAVDAALQAQMGAFDSMTTRRTAIRAGLAAAQPMLVAQWRRDLAATVERVARDAADASGDSDLFADPVFAGAQWDGNRDVYRAEAALSVLQEDQP